MDEEHMSSFGIPIVHRVEGGFTIEDVQNSLAKKLSNLKLSDYPSLEIAIEKELAEERKSFLETSKEKSS